MAKDAVLATRGARAVAPRLRSGHMDGEKIIGSGDDGFNRPAVTPEPAPSDDQLIRLAAVGSAFGALVGFLAMRWLHKRVEVRWRR